MIIKYLNEAGPFGSYKSQSSSDLNKASVRKELARVARKALLDKIYMKVEMLVNEYLDEHYYHYTEDNQSGFVLVGTNGNKKGVYGGWNGMKDAMPLIRLELDNNNKIIVILSCAPLNGEKIVITHYVQWFGWIKYLTKYLNANISQFNDGEFVFPYTGFEVKVEIDRDILNNDNRVNVKFMSILRHYNIEDLNNFLDYFYDRNLRVQTDRLIFRYTFSSKKDYEYYIKNFSDLVKTTGSVAFDLNALETFDIDNLDIASYVVYPSSNATVYYTIDFHKYLNDENSLKNLEKFCSHELMLNTIDEVKQYAFNTREKSYFDGIRKPTDIRMVNISYEYGNPATLTINGTSRL